MYTSISYAMRACAASYMERYRTQGEPSKQICKLPHGAKVRWKGQSRAHPYRPSRHSVSEKTKVRRENQRHSVERWQALLQKRVRKVHRTCIFKVKGECYDDCAIALTIRARKLIRGECCRLYIPSAKTQAWKTIAL